MLIHRFWSGPPRVGDTAFRAAISGHHPSALLIDWTPDDLPWIRQVEDPRHASNVVRYEVLLALGGLWLDHDVFPLCPLDRPWPYTAALGGYREGAVLWFPEPDHPMMLRCAQIARAAAPGLSVSRSGAKVLHQVGLDFPDVKSIELFATDAADRPASPDPWVLHGWETSKGSL